MGAVERPLVTDAALRELAMVLAVGLAGLLLAGLVAFTPWYTRDAGTAIVEVPSPRATPAAQP